MVQSATDRNAWFERVRTELRAGGLAPYLGPGLLSLASDALVPKSYKDLAEFLGSKVTLPKRARGNASRCFGWARPCRSSPVSPP